jgi:quercetin dioxygenase-like cupin family protein
VPIVSSIELPAPVRITDLPETPLSSAHLNHQELPWVVQGGGVEMKLLRVNDDSGQWVSMNRFQPGTELPPHRHSGAVFAFTLRGTWGYRESAFLATPGSLVREPANTSHTLFVPAAASEPAEVIFFIEGALVHYLPDGSIWGISDAHTQLAEYLRLAAEQGHSITRSSLLP